MRILLVGNYEFDSQESMQRFAAFMARGLTEAGHEARLCQPPALFGKLRPCGQGLGKWLGYIDKFVLFPFRLKSEARRADVVHICDHSNSMYTRLLRSVPHVVTCHDLLAVRSALGEIPQNPTRWTGKQLQRFILNGLRRAQHVACASEATRVELLRLARVPEEKVSRIYISLTHPYSPMNASEAAARVRGLGVDPVIPFFIHVGGNQWYKNRLGVLRIFSALRKQNPERGFKLVMVGKPWTAEMRQFVSEHELDDAVVELTGVANEDLRALYSLAAMMVFPSFEEGFGMPIMEAQACGCPVAVARRAPMDEVAGEAGIFIEPDKPEESARIVSQALETENLRESSISNAARFRNGLIENYLALYESIREKKTVKGHAQVDPLMTQVAGNSQ